MRIEAIEKLVVWVAVAAISFVALLVAVLSFMPARSGIPEVAVAAADDAFTYLEQERNRRNTGSAGKIPVLYSAQPALGAQAEALKPTTEGEPAEKLLEYFVDPDENERVDPNDVIEGYPWLRKTPGVTFHQPKRMPRLLYQKYRAYEDVYNLGQEGGGEFVKTSSGEKAYQVNWIQPESMLASRLGLQPGDKVIAVNGNPVGDDMAAGKQLYDQLKDETRFAVMVERGGQKQVLSYYVR